METIRPHLPGRIESLDGLRTIAVLMVFGYHSTTTFLTGGTIGVDVFFGISGFVITLLLIREYDRSDRILLGRFTLARLARLWPALLVVCVAVAVGAAFIPAWSGGALDAVVSGLYSMNFWRALVTDNAFSPLGHTWSLGIEEQFYLIWPILFLLVMRFVASKYRVPVVLGLAAFPVILRLMLWDGGAGLPRIYNLVDTRADHLLIGCALALALDISARVTRIIERIARVLLWPAFVALAGLALFEPIRTLTPEQAQYHYTFGYLVTSVLTGVIVVGLATNERSIPSRLLSSKWLSWPGKHLSYGMYLWHYPLLVLPIVYPNQGVRIVCVLAATVGLAYVSARFLESPIRQRVHHLLDRRRLRG